MRDAERVQTVIIGAGQAGLSVGYHLARRGLPFVILEANERVGDSWRKRWDSLRLFTPARFDALPGMPFPATRFTFPTKDEMGDYLESYVARFHLPVRTGVAVNRLSRRGSRFLVEAGEHTFDADQVVVAMAGYQRPSVPAFAKDLDRNVLQMHSSEYRNLSQLREGSVLLVGAGNSGAEIAKEVALGGHPAWLSGRDTGQVPYDIESFAGRHLLMPLLLRFIFYRLLTTNTPMGRAARPKIMHKGTPLIRLKTADLTAVGVERVVRMAGVRDGKPLLEDGRVLDAANVIWCTGYHPGFSWIDLPIFDKDGDPVHDRGVVARAPGLYFVGLPFLYAMASSMIHGVGRDADYVANAISDRVGPPKTVAERRAELVPADRDNVAA